MNEPVEDVDDEDLEMRFETGPDHANLKILPPYIFLIFFMLGIVLELFYGIDLFRWQIQIFIGLILIICAVPLFLWSAKTMIEEGTPLSPDEPTLLLVEHGPYAFSRNPIYLSYGLLYLGIVFFFDIVWAMALFVPMIYCVIKFSIEPEENYLGRKFSKDYHDYKSHVRRWI